MQVTVVAINSLKHYAKNRKKHPKEQVERLARLIEQHGFRDPLIVDEETMEVIAGNGTLMAAKHLKMTEIPCILQKFESEEQKYAFSISHNAIQTWSEIDFSQIHKDLPDLAPFDIELLGIREFRFEPNVDTITKGDETAVWNEDYEFESSQQYISLKYIFKSLEARNNFVLEKQIQVSKKINDYSWIVYQI